MGMKICKYCGQPMEYYGGDEWLCDNRNCDNIDDDSEWEIDISEEDREDDEEIEED